MSVFDKIAAALPDKISLSPDWIDSRFSFFPEPTTTIDPDVWKAVFTALRDDRRLLMEYQVPGHLAPKALKDMVTGDLKGALKGYR